MFQGKASAIHAGVPASRQEQGSSASASDLAKEKFAFLGLFRTHRFRLKPDTPK